MKRNYLTPDCYAGEIYKAASRLLRCIMLDMTETLSQAMRRLATRGFTHGLVAVEGQLRDLSTGELFDPEILSIEEVVRFEGDSDPDEQAALFALRLPSGGALGTYTVVYGPAMPAEDAHVVRRLAVKS